MSRCKHCGPDDWDDYSYESIDEKQAELDRLVNSMTKEQLDSYHFNCERAVVMTTEGCITLARDIKGMN